tara:strand:+ start:4786 stop:7608 length:2823 start_codon:yes stop_codon:yes gene_type:complete
MKIKIKKFAPYLVGVITLLTISIIYFSPAINGYSVFQSDIVQHKGVSNEVVDFRNEFNDEPLWTNSLFGGMPATQISVYYKLNLLKYVENIYKLSLPHPINVFFIYMLGFYIFLLCMNVNPWLSLVGAIAYGFSSYFFIILDVGHNSKAMSMAYMAPSLGGFLMILRSKKLLGCAVFTLFTSFQISSNHPQVTYYLFLLFGVLFFYELVKNIKNIKQFFPRIILLALGSLLAISTSVPNLYGTYEYSKFSQRAGSELTSSSLENGKSNDNYKSRALMWSYGKGESWSFLIPDIKGGGDASLAQNDDFNNSSGYENLKRFMNNQGVNHYWGNQPSTAGPVYIGSVICFLFFLALIFWRDRIKWAILVFSLFVLFLSWGKNMQWFTDIFWNYLPFYKNLRAVTIILILLELLFCVTAFLWLNEVVKNKSWWKDKFYFFGSIKTEITNRKMFFYSSGIFTLTLFVFSISPTSFFDLLSERELSSQFNVNTLITQRDSQANDIGFLNKNNITKAQLLAYYDQSIIPLIPKAKEDLINYRKSVLSNSAIRSLIFILISFILLLLFIKGKLANNLFLIFISCLFLVDMWPIARRYLNNEKGESRDYKHWVNKKEKIMPLVASSADRSILNNEILENKEIGNLIKDHLAQTVKESNEKLQQREIDRILFGKLNRLTNYRVLNIPTGIFQETSTSYFHKSLGGYHSAKIQRYQDLIDTILPYEIQRANRYNISSIPILSMLNTKYIITNSKAKGPFVKSIAELYSMNRDQQSNVPGIINENRLGNAWFVKEVKGCSGPNDEFNHLKIIEPLNYAIADSTYKFNNGIISKYDYDTSVSISMKDYRANKITYQISGLENKDPSKSYYVVFSEVFYPLGWKAKLDGKSVKINRVNYTLRGLVVSGGTSEVELYYELESFNNLSFISLLSSSSILILISIFFYLSAFKNKDE